MPSLSRRQYRVNAITPGWNLSISLILVLVTCISVLPVLLVVIISFSPMESIGLRGYSYLPTSLTLSAYESVFKMGSQLRDSYLVSIFVAITKTSLSLFVMSMYSFVLAQKRFGPRRVFIFITFFTMLFSGGLVPSYIINTRYLSLYDNIWALLIPGLVGGFNVIILRTFIQTTIPDSLFEAAKIDGANDFVIYARIVLPLFKAGLATIGLFSVVGIWNDWFSGMLYINSPKLMPLQTMLMKIMKNLEYIKNNSDLSSRAEFREILRRMPVETTRMAIVVLSVAPILFAYPFFQQYFVKGLTIGSVKG